MSKKIMAANLETNEVYECNKAKAIADIASYRRISLDEARNQLGETSEEFPIAINDCEIWEE